MKYDSFKIEGIVIKRKNYKEADKLITVFSKEKGKIILLAKGVRRLNSRKSSSVELFNSLNLYYLNNNNFNILTETQLINSYSSWKGNLIRVGVAYYLCELIDKLMPEQQVHADVYLLLENSLFLLEKSPLSHLIRDFEEKLLDLLGYGLPEPVLQSKGSIVGYIESITERHIVSPKIIKSFL